MIRSLCFIFFLSLISGIVQSQNPRYLVRLKDKNPANNPYSLENPGEFLSLKAIERREKQNISYDSLDLPIAPVYIDSLLSTGIKIQNKSKWFNSVVAEMDSSRIEELKKFSFVEEIIFLAPPKQFSESKDNSGTQSYDQAKFAEHLLSHGDSIYYGISANQIKLAHGHVLHENGYKGEGISIAVLDGGFNKVDKLPAFDSLWTNGRILGTRNFEDRENGVFRDHYHGTYVLSILGANLPDKLYGSAPEADYWLLRTEVTSSEYLVEEYNWIAAAEFADSAGADIINSSLGYSEFDDSSQNHTYEELDGQTTPISKAAQIAANRGILVVVSAGNLGNSPWNYISAPADAYDILTVGATNQYGDYVSFSSKGPSSDGRIKPEVSAQGQGTFFQSGDSSIVAGSGTSFSAPIISGLAACLWQKNNESDYLEIRETIIRNSSQFDSPDTLLGFGIPDFASAAGIEYMSANSQQKITQGEPKVYPNPFRNSFTISFSNFSKDIDSINIKIVNITGSVICKKSIVSPAEGHNVNIDELKKSPPGIYFVEVRYNQNLFYRQKLIKVE